MKYFLLGLTTGWIVSGVIMMFAPIDRKFEFVDTVGGRFYGQIKTNIAQEWFSPPYQEMVVLNFPIADMNRNVIWHDPEGVRDEDVQRMNAFWGDESWRSIAYTTKKDLFGHKEKEPNIVVAEGFKKRLKEEAGFEYVSDPLPMKNSMNAIIYYLFFASNKPVAKDIIEHIFKKHGKGKS